MLGKWLLRVCSACTVAVLFAAIMGGCAHKPGKPATAQAPEAAAQAPTPPDSDQAMTVNLLFRGADQEAGGKPLDHLHFSFAALWGANGRADRSVAMASRETATAAFEVPGGQLKITPQVTHAPYGQYDIRLVDAAGRIAGWWRVVDAGHQVQTAGATQGYNCEAKRYDVDKRITGFLISKPRPGYGRSDPEWGVVFVGRGWAWVEDAKLPDMSKGFLFPEVDVLVWPRDYMSGRDFIWELSQLKGGKQSGMMLGDMTTISDNSPPDSGCGSGGGGG